MSGRDGVRWATVTIVLLVLAACGGGGGSGGSPDAGDAEPTFAFVQASPTNGQQVSGDLAEVGGQIEILFSAPLDKHSVIDKSNAYTGLTADVNILDSNLNRAAGTPIVDGGTLRYTPPASGLDPQQYTITLSYQVRSKGGQTLPRYRYSSFTVGPDQYAPVIRRVFPVADQKDVPRDTSIRITFNESLDTGSVNGQTLLVQDGGQNPPTTIAGEVFLENDGFEAVFVPDPAVGLPLGTTVVVTVQGGNAGIADATARLSFVGDPTNGNRQIYSFSTGGTPSPLNPFEIASVYFSNQASFGVIDIGPYVGYTALTQDGKPGVLPSSLKKIGDPGEIVVDPRVNSNGDSFAYVVDAASSTVAVLNTFNSRIVGRIAGRSPRGLAIHPNGTFLYVTQAQDDTVAVFDIRLARPGTNGWDPDRQKGSAIHLKDLQTGRGPTGIAHAPDRTLLFVCNSLESTVTIFNTTNDSVYANWAAGDDPRDVAVTYSDTRYGWSFACVTNRGSDTASFWWSSFPNVQQWLLTGLNAPWGVVAIDTTPQVGQHWWEYFRFYLANSGGSTVTEVRPVVTGTTFTGQVSGTISVGSGPQNVTIEPGTLTYGFTSDRFGGTVSVFDRTNPSRSLPAIPVPGVSWVSTRTNQ